MDGTVDLQPLAGLPEGRRLSADEQANLLRPKAVRHPHPHALLADGQDLAHGALHHHRVRQVHEVDGEGLLLPPHGHVEDTRGR